MLVQVVAGSSDNQLVASCVCREKRELGLALALALALALVLCLTCMGRSNLGGTTWATESPMPI